MREGREMEEGRSYTVRFPNTNVSMIGLSLSITRSYLPGVEATSGLASMHFHPSVLGPCVSLPEKIYSFAYY